MRLYLLLVSVVCLVACAPGTDTATRPATSDIGPVDVPVGAPDVVVDAMIDAPDAAADVATDVAMDDGLINGCPTYPMPVGRPGDDPAGDTWSGFAQGFFMRWCVRCHTTELTSPESRSGAPAMLNWNVEATVRGELVRIRNDVGVTNYMPFNPPRAPCDERRRLVRWIDIGAP